MLDLPALYAQCAPQVHPVTMDRVVWVESGRKALALNVNRKPGEVTAPRPAQPRTVDEAVATALAYMQAGHSVDLGLAQVNSRNLHALGMTVREAFELPCRNLAAGAAILADCYDRAIRASQPPGDPALRWALSCYNAGPNRLHVNPGYVSKYGIVPPVSGSTVAAENATVPPAPKQKPANPMTAPMLVAGWEGAIERQR